MVVASGHEGGGGAFAGLAMFFVDLVIVTQDLVL